MKSFFQKFFRDIKGLSPVWRRGFVSTAAVTAAAVCAGMIFWKFTLKL